MSGTWPILLDTAMKATFILMWQENTSNGNVKRQPQKSSLVGQKVAFILILGQYC